MSKSAGKINVFRYYCQKVLPAVYDDSLSYYEAICKMVAKLNETICSVNKNSCAIRDIYDTLAQFVPLSDVDRPISIDSGYFVPGRFFYNKVTIPREVYEIGAMKHSSDYPEMSVYEAVKANPGIDFFSNASLRGAFVERGVALDNPVEGSTYWGILSFTQDGTPKYIRDVEHTWSAASLIADGAYTAFPCWSALMINGLPFDYSRELPHDHPSYESIVTNKHPRTIFAYDDDNYYVVTIEGREPRSDGATYDDMQHFCLWLGFHEAFNLDGGGSTQAWLNNPPQNLVFSHQGRDYDANSLGYNSRDVYGLFTFKEKSETCPDDCNCTCNSEYE